MLLTNEKNFAALLNVLNSFRLVLINQAGVRFEPLMYHAPIHLERFLPYYSCDSIAMVLRGYAKLDIKSDVLLEVLTKSLHRFTVNSDRYPLNHLTSIYTKKQTIDEISSDDKHQVLPVDDTSHCSSRTLNSMHLEDPSTSFLPPKPISLVWVLESLAQWNVNREEVG